MDNIDKKILNKIQRDFPIVDRPYLNIAHDLGISEQEVIDRITNLSHQKILRKIGASIAPRTIGYTTTLVAASVCADKLEDVVAEINNYPEVTHNYGRENEFNLWFTLVCPNRDEISRLCNKISEMDGVKSLLELPATHLFKLDVFFDMTEDDSK
jgi:DNA-binding Lrp family transcriptional regulator